uniref:Prominin-1-A-like n=2 Tax=Cynoglossus semilaevis TaxID=244447 RepID=A0A3P8VEC2_CYNSE
MVGMDSTDPDYGKHIREQLLLHISSFYVSALVLGAYVLAMPTSGIIVACCRSCGNLGGKMYQQQNTLIHCERKTIFGSLLCISLVIFAGTMNMFKSHQSFKDGMEQTPSQFAHMLTNIFMYVQALPLQVGHVQRESEETVREVTKNFQDIGPLLGGQIQERLLVHLKPVFDEVKLLNEDNDKMSAKLQQLQSFINQIQSNLDNLQQDVQSVKGRLTLTLAKPECTGCELLQSDLDSLDLKLNHHITIPTLKEFWDEVNEVITIKLTLKMEKVNNYLDSIPNIIASTNPHVTNLEFMELPPGVQTPVISQVISQFTTLLYHLQIEMGNMRPYAAIAYWVFKEIWWKCGFAVCGMLLFILMCNCLGMILGIVGLKPKADPTMRSKTADCGGTFFLVSTGLSFFFSWLLMLIVLALFFIGGTFYTVICRPLRNGQILKAVDSTEFIIQLRESFGQKSAITATSIISDCKQNKPLWTTIKLKDSIDLEEMLNVSEYIKHAQTLFDSTHITVSAYTILSPEVQNQLREFSAKAKDFNTNANTHQTDYMFSVNLNAVTEALEFAALRIEDVVQEELRNEAKILTSLQDRIETVVIPQLKDLNSTVIYLRSLAANISERVEDVLRIVGVVQNILNTNTEQIVRTESMRFLDNQIDHIKGYKKWATKMVTQDIGQCRPLSEILYFLENIFCAYLVEPLNIFWLSLFWSLILFIPNISLSLLLSKYYRVMEYSDEYDDPIIMNNIIMYPDGNRLKIHESYYFGDL